MVYIVYSLKSGLIVIFSTFVLCLVKYSTEDINNFVLCEIVFI